MKAYTEQSERQQAQTIEEVRKARERQREADLRLLMGAEWGRRIAHWLIFEHGRAMSSSVNPRIKHGMELHALFHEGRRDSAIDLHNEFYRLAPEDFLRMGDEHRASVRIDLALEADSAGRHEDASQ